MEKYWSKLGIGRVEGSNFRGRNKDSFTLSTGEDSLSHLKTTPSTFYSTSFGGVYYSYGEVFPVSTALIILSFV